MCSQLDIEVTPCSPQKHYRIIHFTASEMHLCGGSQTQGLHTTYAQF